MATLHTPDPDLDRAFALASRRGEELVAEVGDTPPSGALIGLAAALLAAGVRAPARRLVRLLEVTPHAPSLERERLVLRRALSAWASEEHAVSSVSSPDPASSHEAGPDLARTVVRFLQEPTSAGAAETTALLDAVTTGLWGLEPDAPAEAILIRPRLPRAWTRMGYNRLRVGAGILDLEVLRRHGDLVARIHRVGGPSTVITVEPEPAPAGRVVVDDVELPPGRARFEAIGRHEVVFQDVAS